MNIEYKKLHTLSLHASITVAAKLDDNGSERLTVTRVPGGLIYYFRDLDFTPEGFNVANSVFVPFTDFESTGKGVFG